MNSIKRTKIVATLGPASASAEKIRELILAGTNAFRLNFSHGTHESHARLIGWIKEIRRELDTPVAILQDLSGPKIRLGNVAPSPLLLKSGDQLILKTEIDSSSGNELPVTYPGLAADVQEGHRLLLADGNLEVQIEEIKPPRVICRVITGGALSSHKGINYPEGSFKQPAVTEKDREDLKFGLKQGVDYVALSFVKTAEDIREAREICRAEGREVPLIAKIEKHEAIDNFFEILNEVDGVMVARGDLGVEVPLERVPMVQKKVIRLANLYGKPVITATQMLLSMVEAPRPTRAETTDIANAILDGTDAIMLSEETASGKHPVLAVATMQKIALETEKQFPFYDQLFSQSDVVDQDIARSISASAVSLAHNLNADMLICPTHSGFTARMISRLRPRAAVLALTSSMEVYYRLALLWGVIPLFLPVEQHMEKLLHNAISLACKNQFLSAGDRYVVTAGFPFGKGGPTNLINAGEVPA